VISVYGADKPGIVYQVSSALAKAKVNIHDVHTHRSTGNSPSLYLLLLEVEAPPRHPAEKLKALISQIGRKLGVQVSVRPADTAIL
jgi:glycine cleavage system transcriptional repressor